jgi:hypothetical protein
VTSTDHLTGKVTSRSARSSNNNAAVLASSSPATDLSSYEANDLSIHDGRRESKIFFFRTYVRFKNGQSFSDLLDARKQEIETTLASATINLWACTNTARIQTQNYIVHAATLIRL